MVYSLDKRQRENLAKIIADVGKIVFAAIVVGKFVSPEKIILLVFIFGAVFSIFCFVSTIIIDKEVSK